VERELRTIAAPARGKFWPAPKNQKRTWTVIVLFPLSAALFAAMRFIALGEAPA